MEIVHKTHMILSTLPIILLIYIMTLCAGINISHLVMEFYHYRVVWIKFVVSLQKFILN